MEHDGSLTIIMYHYVREIAASAYPNIRGLEIAGFRRQLDYLAGKYTFVSGHDLVAFLKGENPDLPEDGCLLTFDDGYRDHVEFVLPELARRGLSGCFFPSARPIVDKTLLDVNAIHFILSCADDTKGLVNALRQACRHAGVSDEELAALWKKCAKPSRYDTAEVIFFKRLLQRELPKDVRTEVTTQLFQKYVGRSEAEFCDELYMSINDIRTLVAAGMYVGSHTYNHYWLDAVDRATQDAEIEKSLDFLGEVGAPTRDWIMCYPYGAYNVETLSVLRERHCIAALTTQVGTASLRREGLLELKRWDTNDFPQ